uniref:Uncharacterized protein n=1 Tax=Strigamia maritima TaxID=126957 RepID=T1IK19_STRMM
MTDYSLRKFLSSDVVIESPVYDLLSRRARSKWLKLALPELLDVSTELNGGCKGVAARYMHWPEELIVGGVKKNRTGHIMRAKAIQTIIPLMGERQMHEFWKDNYKVHNLNWNEEKAKEIIETWQRKFASEVQKHVAVSNLTKHQRITVFSTTSLSDILRDFSEINVFK